MTRFWLWNCNGLNPDRLNEIQVLASQQHQYDVLCLTETKRRKEKPPSLLGYNGHHSFRDSQNVGGGVSLFLHHSIESEPVDDFCFPKEGDNVDKESHPECIAVKIKCPEAGIVLLCAIYIPPSATTADEDQLFSRLSDAINKGHNILVLGDLNAKHPSWSPLSRSNARGHKIWDWCIDNGCMVMNDHQPTFVGYTRDFQSTIDLYISNQPTLFTEAHPSDPLQSEDLLQYHLPVECDLVGGDPNENHDRAGRDALLWALEGADWEGFCKYLEQLSTDWLHQFSTLVEEMKDDEAQFVIEEAWRTFRARLQIAGHRYVGKKKIKKGFTKWWNLVPGIPEAHEELQQARKRLHRKPSDPVRKQIVCEKRTAFKKLSRAAKRLGWQLACNQVEQNRRIQWPMWKRLKGSTGKGGSILDIKITAPDRVQDPGNIADAQQNLEVLAEAFASISSVANHISDPSTETIVSSALRGERPEGCRFRPQDSDTDDEFFEPHFIQKELESLPNKRSVGPDDIPYSFLKHMGPLAIEALTALYNFSWLHGVLPQEWTCANTIPIFKGGGPKRDPDNYRPISITCAAVRLFERIIYGRLAKRIDSKLSDYQAGFRKGRSTLDQITLLHDRALSAMDSRSYVCSAFLDLKKAFDKVWWDGLLYKLLRMGIRGRPLRWLRAFLSNRYIRVTHNQSVSGWKQITSGVPQGSVLAPLLFLVYINDLLVDIDTQTACMPLAFADDLNITPKAHDGHEGDEYLSQALKICSRWAVRWKMEWGIKKCGIVCFNNKRDIIMHPHFMLGNQQIPEVICYTYLGVTFKYNLSWHPHYHQTVSKMQQRAHLVNRLLVPGSRISPRTVRVLTLAAVRSTLYGLAIWQPPNQKAWKRLRALLTQPLLRCLHLPNSAPRDSLLVEFGIPDLEVWRQQLQLRYGNRLLQHNTRRHPTARAISNRHTEVSRYKRPVRWYIGQQIAEAEQLWQIEDLAAEEMPALQMPKALMRSYDLWHRESAHSPLLRQIRFHHKLAPYIKFDNRVHASIRARLRLQRANIAADRKRQNMVESAHCQNPEEKWPSAETAEHILLECQLYQPAREEFILELKKLGLRDNADDDINLHMDEDYYWILGEYRPRSDTKPDRKKAYEFYNASGRLLLAIQRTRNNGFL